MQWPPPQPGTARSAALLQPTCRYPSTYQLQRILDNLPVAMVKMRKDSSTETLVKTYERGYPVGFKASVETDIKFFIHNHLRFTILYHKDVDTDLARIVGFEVEPFSVKHDYEAPWDPATPVLKTCSPGRMVYVTHNLTPQPVEDGSEVIFSYDVKFVGSDIKWASRWDTYLLMMDDQIHWFSIVNSVMIVLFLSGMIAMIMMRTLARDITKYNQLDAMEDAQEETGWKLVHGDVFRPPPNASLLCTYVGTGIQIFGMTLVTMVFALLGFLSPANRGGLMTAVLMIYVFMGLFAGYFSARLYKSFRGEDFSIFFALNLMIWGQKSSGAVPFGTLFALCFLWFGISTPLVFVGSYFGYKKPAAEDPVRTNKIPRQVPEQAWYMNPIFSCLVGGVLPFGAVFIELFFILTSIWHHQFYYLFGFLALVFVILLITCAEITIVLCYFQLWWRAYFTAGSSAVYLFLYSAFYFYSKLDITKTVPMLMYFGYMLITSYAFFTLTGTMGFYACYYFVRVIYAAVK
eukprot:gene30680-35704_t